MALTPKRKRASRSKPSSKRPKYAETSDSARDEGGSSEEEYWLAERILEEKAEKGTRKYLVQWQGHNSATGIAWPPTWEPRKNCSELLLASWEIEKTRTRGWSEVKTSSQPRTLQLSRKPCAGRVEDSTGLPTLPTTIVDSAASAPAPDSVAPACTPSAPATPIGATIPAVPHASPYIAIPRRGSSFNGEDFQGYFQLAGWSQSSSARSQSQQTELDSSQLFATTRAGLTRACPYSSGIVQDSQDAADEASFLPDTQHTGDSSQQSTATTQSQDEDITELSNALRDTPSRDPSPARSIAETVADSQTQLQRPDTQILPEAPDIPALIEISDSATVDSSSQVVGQVHNPDGDVHGQGRHEDEQQGQYQDDHVAGEPPQSLPAPDIVYSFIQVPHTQPEDEPPSQSGDHNSPGIEPDTSTSAFASPCQETGAGPGTIDCLPVLTFQPQHPEHPRIRWNREKREFLGGKLTEKAPAQTGPTQHTPGPASERDNTPWQALQSQQSHSVPDTTKHRESACDIQTLDSSAQSTGSREQNAQVVPFEGSLTTQEDVTESIQTSIENIHNNSRESSESRHDSSQDSPGKIGPVDPSSSPIPNPPNFSFHTVPSKFPSRPSTPAPSSSWSIMSGEGTGSQVARELKERLEKARLERPFVPKRRMARIANIASPINPDSSLPTFVSAHRLLETSALTLVHDGTRSPSAVPDHAPEPPARTNLSSVVAASSGPIVEMVDRDEDMGNSKVPITTAQIRVHVLADKRKVPSEASEAHPEDNSEHLSDADEEVSASLLHDDLQLEPMEYIVPLFIEGRQLDMYVTHIQQQKDILRQFLNDPHGFAPLSKVDTILAYFRAIETHIDLIFAEAESISMAEETSTQFEHTARFGIENSAKFRFLHAFFSHLREHKRHVVLVTEQDNEAFFHILEMFCKAEHVNYSMPTRHRQAEATDAKDSMLVTIIPGSASPILRTPDLIIGLDGVQNASQIRLKNWARSSVREYVPVLHLVIPRAVGHIERYLSPNLSQLDHMHTVVAGLAQISINAEIGQPVDGDTPCASTIGAMVVDWLIEPNDNATWPLPCIGSIKDVIEYQSQLSTQRTAIPAIERSKRPLDSEDLDPSKRMRLTPQPTPASPILTHEAEVTRISDSMPGTTEERFAIESLRQHLARAEEALRQEQADHQASRETMEMWEKQLTAHEELRQEHRTVLQHSQDIEAKLERANAALKTKSELLITRTDDLNARTRQLEEQRATDLLSPDAKIAEITRLRQELTTAQDERMRARREADTANNILDFIKEARRAAENELSTARSTIAALTTEKEKLAHQASGQAVKLKTAYFDRQMESLTKQSKRLIIEREIMKKTLLHKEEELVRARTGKAGVGTRGTSVTPQPKARSRAASPMGGRISNLRKE